MLEKTIEKNVCLHAKLRRVYCRKFVSPNRRGVPDRLFIYDGRVLFIEFKAPGCKPTLLQSLEIQSLRDAGVWVEVCSNTIAGKTLIDKLVDG